MKLLMLLVAFTISVVNAQIICPRDNKVLITDSNSIVINDVVTDELMTKKSLEVLEKSKKDPSQTLYLVMYTPGGSVTAGNLFIEYLKGIPNPIVTITIFAASMGYHIVQALPGERLILETGELMSHRAKLGGMGGEIPGELLVRIGHIKALIDSMDLRVSNRINMSLPEYQKLIADEFWVTGQEAVNLSHADRVVTLVCDESLNGFEKLKVRTMLGSFEATFSKCPLIVGPIDVEAGDQPEEKVREAILTSRKKAIWSY